MRAWHFGVGKSETTVPIRSRFAVNTAEAAIDAAIADVGVTRVLSYQIAHALKSTTLIAALEGFEPPQAPVHLVYSGHALLPQKLRAFLDFARPRLRARLSDLAAGTPPKASAFGPEGQILP
jgi:DNA-binding transcriptional LysR family regulator